MFSSIIKQKWYGAFQKVCCPDIINGTWIHFTPLSSFQLLLIFLKRLQYQHIFNWNMLLAAVEFSDKQTAPSSYTSHAVRKEKKEVLGWEHYEVSGRVVPAVMCVCTGKLCQRNQTSASEIIGGHKKRKITTLVLCGLFFGFVLFFGFFFCWAFF